MQGDHTLRIAGVGRTYVSALAQLAAKDGLIDLDQTIDHYMDEEILDQLPDALRPTIRQLRTTHRVSQTTMASDFISPIGRISAR